MCNARHADSEPIPKTGFGWKLFEAHLGSLRPIVFTHYLYLHDDKGRITWLPKYAGDGFCFFLTKREAVRVAKEWNADASDRDAKVYHIQYTGGICQHDEHSFLGWAQPIPHIALCKSFKVLSRNPQ